MRRTTAARDPVAVARVLDQVAVLVAAGVPPPRAWTLVGGRPDDPSPAWQDVRVVLEVADRTGAPSATALRSLSAAMRRSASADRAVLVALAGPRASARVVLALPILGLALGTVWGAGALEVLLTTPVGWACCVTAAGLVAVGQRWSRRMVLWATPDGHVPGIELDAWAVALSGGGSWQAAETTVREALAARPADARPARSGGSARPAGPARPGDSARPAGSARPGGSARAEEDARLGEALDLSRRAGVPAAALLRAAAEDLRDDAAAAGLAAAERLGVRLVLPLGTCVLPAFVLLGVVPVVVGVLSSTVDGIR